MKVSLVVMVGWIGFGSSPSGPHMNKSKMSAPSKTVPSFQCFAFMASTSFLSVDEALSSDLGISPSTHCKRLKTTPRPNFFEKGGQRRFEEDALDQGRASGSYPLLLAALRGAD